MPPEICVSAGKDPEHAKAVSASRKDTPESAMKLKGRQRAHASSMPIKLFALKIFQKYMPSILDNWRWHLFANCLKDFCQ